MSSRLLSKANSDKSLCGLSLAPRAPPLTHLFFADDALIFGKATKEELYKTVSILNAFTGASGQRISSQKSGIIFGKGVPRILREDLAAILNIPMWESPGKYLGIPAEWSNSRGQALQ